MNTADRGTTTKIQGILNAASDGKIENYDELIAVASGRLMKITRRMLRSYPHLRRWEQTDDVFQEAALRLYRSLSDVRPDSVRGFFGLASTQIRRTLIDLARHYFGAVGLGAKHESTSSSGSGDIAGRPLENESVETLDMWARFHASVESLPEEERETFSLIWYGGATQKQAAAVIGVSERTIKRRFYSARIQLAQMLRCDTDESP